MRLPLQSSRPPPRHKPRGRPEAKAGRHPASGRFRADGIAVRSSVRSSAGVPGNTPMSGGSDFHRRSLSPSPTAGLRTGHAARKSFFALLQQLAQPRAGALGDLAVLLLGPAVALAELGALDPRIGEAREDESLVGAQRTRERADAAQVRAAASRSARSRRGRPRPRSHRRHLPAAARGRAPPARDCARPARGDGRRCARGSAARARSPCACGSCMRAPPPSRAFASSSSVAWLKQSSRSSLRSR